MKYIEELIERSLFWSRWLLAPLYLGLSLLMILFSVKFFQELWFLLPKLWELSETNLILAALTLVDLVLVGNLLVMVILAGYENFVSRIEVAQKDNQLAWLGKVDAGTLKIKLAVSIVAISSIYLLKAFMDTSNISDTKLMWMVIIHLTFVLSALLLAVIDKIAFSHHRNH